VIEQRLIAAGGLPIAAKLVAALSLACLVLGLLLALSVYVNVRQHRGGAAFALEMGGKLAASEARGRAELQACADTNARVNLTVKVLGDELHACRGEEQRVGDALLLAQRQRARALREADGQARMRREAVEAIGRTHESCNRPICRALSDELLGHPAGGDAR
jgi:hypothetical protein